MALWQPIDELARQVKSGEVKAVDLVRKSLDQIAHHQEYAAIITILEDRALAQAAQIDKKIAAGQDVGVLAGVPYIAKDNFLVFGGETTAASNILKGFEAPYQSTAIEKLEAAGAICVAKANLDAFAHGSSTENSDFMVTKNPHSKAHVPGGSSGGSAAAVVLEMAPFALGTDTGGSIRLPASFTGSVGYKPTYGLVSRSGVIAMASSTDVVGPLTMTVHDAALVMDVIAGRDDLDSTTISCEDVVFSDATIELKGKKIGVVKEYMTNDVNPAVRQSVEFAVQQLKAAGCVIEEISLPSLPLALACYYVIMPAEVSSNLSRYDGQHFGFSETAATNLDESFSKTRSQGFGNEAKRRIMIGTYVLSSGYYDAYYNRAQQLRTKLINEFNQAFEQVDILLGPTAPDVAFEIGQHSNPLQMYLTDIMTVAANLVGIPAISIPAGKQDNLPIGLQLMAAQRQDKHLLGFAEKTEELIHE